MSVTVLLSDEPEDRPGATALAAIPGVRIAHYTPGKPPPEAAAATAEVLIPPYRSSRRAQDLLPQLPSLRLVQLLSAGTDQWAGTLPTGVALSDCRGAHGPAVAEWIITAALASLRQIPELLDHQRHGTWAHRMISPHTLAGAPMLILGAGDIGTTTARYATALGARPTLVARTARPGIHPISELTSLLPQHPITVLALPLTHHTRRIADAAFLHQLPDGALLINAGRGQLIDTNALLPELQAQRIRAALDVTDPEPLPPEHPLWHAPGTLVSPHMARAIPGQSRAAYAVAATQVDEWTRGNELPNLVSRR